MKKLIMVALMVLLTTVASASGLLLTSDVGGAKLEVFNETTHAWVASGTLPRLFIVERYTYLLVRVSATGYQSVEQGFTVRDPGTVHINLTLELDNPNPNSLGLFAFGGQVTSRSGRLIAAGSYIVMARNLSTYVSGANQGQKTQDINPIENAGWYTLTLADLGTNRAVAVGDKIFVGVFNQSKSQCFTFSYFTVTETDIANGYIQADMKMK